MLDHLTQITGAEHHAADALRLQQSELMRQKRLSSHWQQGFGNFRGERTQTCGESACEDGDGEVVEALNRLSLGALRHLNQLFQFPLPSSTPFGWTGRPSKCSSSVR